MPPTWRDTLKYHSPRRPDGVARRAARLQDWADLMRQVGIAIMLCGLLVWLFGRSTVRRARIRRMGRTPLTFDASDASRPSEKHYAAQERRTLLACLAVSLDLSATGAALVGGFFG